LHCGILSRDRGLAMDLFRKNRFILPIEIVIVIAINLVVVVAGYYAIMMWGLFRSWGQRATKLPESLLLLARSWWTLRWDGMPYGSAKKWPVIAAVGALALATLISLGAVYGLSRPLDPDELTTGSAAPLNHPWSYSPRRN
jgi:hypothetical protein